MRINRVDKVSLARAAFHAAYKCRANQSKTLHEAINVVDLAASLGIPVRYVDLPSLEGMYVREPVGIYISSLRPTVRQNFTCAHELGHHCFNHGSQIEELTHSAYTATRADPNEYIANTFAAFLLMPRTAVTNICTARGHKFNREFFTPANVYSVANRLGVGYTTLTNQLYYGFALIDRGQYAFLNQQNLKSIRKDIASEYVPGHLIDIHQDWVDTPIDVCVGDHLLFRFNVNSDSNNIERIKPTPVGVLYLVRRPGIVTVKDSLTAWSNQIRISRPSYVGLAEYRHLEDPEYE